VGENSTSLKEFQGEGLRNKPVSTRSNARINTEG
jgi:hypothetical protein